MGRNYEQTTYKMRKKWLWNIWKDVELHNKRDTDGNYNEIYFSSIRLGRIQNLNNTMIAETVRKQALSYIIAGKAKWYKHWREFGNI